MKPCIGCKFLVAYGRACKADEQLVRYENELTGAVWWFDPRFPGQLMRPSPAEMRKEGGRCGPTRKLYKPSLWTRLTFGDMVP